MRSFGVPNVPGGVESTIKGNILLEFILKFLMYRVELKVFSIFASLGVIHDGS